MKKMYEKPAIVADKPTEPNEVRDLEAPCDEHACPDCGCWPGEADGTCPKCVDALNCMVDRMGAYAQGCVDTARKMKEDLGQIEDLRTQLDGARAVIVQRTNAIEDSIAEHNRTLEAKTHLEVQVTEARELLRRWAPIATIDDLCHETRAFLAKQNHAKVTKPRRQQ